MNYTITSDGLNWQIKRVETKPVKDRKTGCVEDKEITTLVGYFPKLDMAGVAVYEDALHQGADDLMVMGLDEIRELTESARSAAVEAVRGARGSDDKRR